MAKGRVLKRDNNNDSIKLKLDTRVLNSIIAFIRCDYVGMEQINVVKAFYKCLDIPSYEYDNNVYSRLKILEILLQASDKSIRDDNVLLSMISESYPEGIVVLDEIGFNRNSLTTSECEAIFKSIESRVKSISIYKARKKLIPILDRFNTDSFDVTFYDMINDVKEICNELVADLQDTDVGKSILKKFSFGDTQAAKILSDVLTKTKMPSAILQTGIRQLNAVLSPGFRGTRLYTIIGGSGKFKSGTLLNLADQIRMYNPQIIPYENGVRKAILFVTLENTIEESLIRIYDMYSDKYDTFEEKNIEEILETFRENGKLDIGGTNGIDISFMYAGNLAISTIDIKNEIHRLRREENIEVICCVVDYIKRLNTPHNTNGDERVRISFVSKDLKNLAVEENIPIITAMQLNREGNAILDAAMRDNKQDVARFVGTSSIGNAWDIIEESDWVALINLEMQRSTNKLFLTFKSLKQRFKKQASNGDIPNDYFNHPFVNDKNIRLMSDVDRDECVSIISLASDLISIEEQDDNENNAQRPVYGKKSSSQVLSILNNVESGSLI